MFCLHVCFLPGLVNQCQGMIKQNMCTGQFCLYDSVFLWNYEVRNVRLRFVRWSELVLAYIELILGHVIFSTILIQKLNRKLFILFLNSNLYPFYQ